MNGGNFKNKKTILVLHVNGDSYRNISLRVLVTSSRMCREPV